eukprot:GHRR01007945.1.p4 GENE.GHRR01007945.1~~GHRR01007945.1.p4  ORF type:complete len:114 (-),score=44.21 GHRR01007945.1:1790-2131(-)
MLNLLLGLLLMVGHCCLLVLIRHYSGQGADGPWLEQAAVAAGQAGSPKQHQTSSSEEAASEARNSTIRTGMLGQEQASTSLKPLIVTRNVSSRVSRVSTRQEQLARSIRASTR